MFIALLFVYSCTSFIIKNKSIPRILNCNMVTKSLSVGIERTLSDYISHIKPTRVDGFVKFLLEDFHVHEIDPGGKVLNLGQCIPVSEVRKAVENKKRSESGEKFLSNYDKTRVLDYPTELFTDLDMVRLDSLLLSLSEIVNSDSFNKVEFPFTFLICKQNDDMKQIRTKVHQWIRTQLPFLESKTMDFKSCKEDRLREYLGSYLDFSTLSPDYNLIHVAPTPQCIKFLSGSRNHFVSQESDSEEGRTLEEMVKSLDLTDYSTYNPKSFSRYLHFNLLKINRETTEVVNMMCKSAKRASFDFFSAGNKDKRGITVQRLCIRRCNIGDLLESITRGWFNDIYLSDFCYKNSKISLGDLRGNHFKVVIRGISDSSTIEQSIQSLKTYGFINYFGLQRFGTKIVGTHMMGAAIIDQRYELALRLILGDIESAKQYNIFNKYYNNIDPINISLNSDYTSYDDLNSNSEDGIVKFKRAIDYYLFDNDPETALKYLPLHLYVEKSILKGILSNLSFEKCLERVPKNILSIYVHSTQSLLFNLAATERLNRFGPRVVVGDLVVTKEEDLSGSSDSECSEDTKLTSNKRIQVLEVNTEAEASRYTVEEVVLPLPGDNVVYPKNMEDFYRKISLENFNIPLDNFSTYKNVDGTKSKCLVSVSGSYRFLIVRPTDVTFQIIDHLENPYQVLIKPEIEDYQEDLERRETPRNLEKIYKLGDQIRNRSALVLACSLPKSSYITVALREILTDESIENNHG